MGYFEVLRSQVEKMIKDGSFIFGAVGSLSFSIPKWITSTKFDREHVTMIIILLLVLMLDHLSGSALASRSPSKKKSSEIMEQSFIHNFFILIICAIGYCMDYILGLGSIIFTALTVAFIYQNFYSFLANIAVLGLEKKYPLWLFKWLQDEIETKKEKYFPNTKKQSGDDNEF